MDEPAVPPSARGVVRTSSFWHEPTSAGRQRWRAGWWDAYDRLPSRNADESYARGREEYLRHFDPHAPQAQEHRLTDTESPVQYLPLERLLESPRNYRKTFNKEKLDELTESVTAPSGRVVEVWRKEDLVAAARAKGIRVKGAAAASPSAQGQKDAREAKIGAAAVRRACEQLVSVAELTAHHNGTEFWRAIALAVVREVWHDTLKRVATRRMIEANGAGLAHAVAEWARGVTESECCGLAVELLACRDAWRGGREPWGDAIVHFAGVFGVDLQEVKRRATEEVAGKAPKAGKKKAAGKTTTHRAGKKARKGTEE